MLLLIDDMILCTENKMSPLKELLKIINQYSKVAD